MDFKKLKMYIISLRTITKKKARKGKNPRNKTQGTDGEN